MKISSVCSFFFMQIKIIFYKNGSALRLALKQRHRETRIFTITAEIHAHSLANFYCEYADRHMNLKFMRCVSEREPAIRQFVIVKNKLMPVFNASVSLLIMNFVISLPFKVVCGSTRLSPRGSTATLTMWWRNSWSITGQTHKKLTSIF